MSRNFDTEIVVVYFSLQRWARHYYSDERALDLASETITRALEHKGSYNPSCPLLIWCRVIMRNLWLNLEQRLDNRRTVRMGAIDARSDSATDQGAILGDLTEVIDRLRSRSVSVDTLLDFADGYSLAEIAESRRLPLGTVKRRVHDGRAILAKALAV